MLEKVFFYVNLNKLIDLPELTGTKFQILYDMICDSLLYSVGLFLRFLNLFLINNLCVEKENIVIFR